MSITLITGVPGSGKTLYAIDKLLRKLVGTSVDKQLENGVIEKVLRTIFSNINGLLLDHELIDGGGVWDTVNTSTLPGKDKTFDIEPVIVGGKTWFYKGNPLGLRNWLSWAKPGSVICFDEFQKYWPPRPNGAPIPPDLQALDTHRHMGVDFILLTQNCMNVDRHILGLVDRHIHIRRVANMNMAVVYEWDHASKSLLYKNSITKSPWRYDKSVFKLYKSAELHTKQKRKLPGLVWFIAAGLAGVVYFAPNLQARINDRIHGQSVSKSQENMPNDGKKQYIENGMLVSVETTTSKTIAPSGPTAPASSPVAVSVAAPVARGCVMVADRCGCQDVTGQVVKADVSECRVVLASDRPVADVSGLQDYPPRAPLPKTTIDLSF